MRAGRHGSTALIARLTLCLAAPAAAQTRPHPTRAPGIRADLARSDTVGTVLNIFDAARTRRRGSRARARSGAGAPPREERLAAEQAAAAARAEGQTRAEAERAPTRRGRAKRPTESPPRLGRTPNGIGGAKWRPGRNRLGQPGPRRKPNRRLPLPPPPVVVAEPAPRPSPAPRSRPGAPAAPVAEPGRPGLGTFLVWLAAAIALLIAAVAVCGCSQAAFGPKPRAVPKLDAGEASAPEGLGAPGPSARVNRGELRTPISTIRRTPPGETP